MVCRFLLLSDEVDEFAREILIDSDATFLDFHETIIRSIGFESNEMASFFICSYDWEKEQEVTLIEMDSGSEYDNLVMEDTPLSELVSDEGQKLLYVFDYVTDRAFFIQLKEIISGKDLDKPQCIRSEGEPPSQYIEEEGLETLLKQEVIDENFYGDEEFDFDELDEESFGNIDFSDGSFPDDSKF